MGNVKSGQEQVRKITRAGTGSYQITLPIGLIRALSWQEGQKIVVRQQGKKLVIEDWKP